MLGCSAGAEAGGGRGRGSHQRIAAPGYRNGATKTSAPPCAPQLCAQPRVLCTGVSEHAVCAHAILITRELPLSAACRHAVSLSGYEGYGQAPQYAQPAAAPHAHRQYAVVSSDDEAAGYSPAGSF